jgi:hypothetical protein
MIPTFNLVGGISPSKISVRSTLTNLITALSGVLTLAKSYKIGGVCYFEIPNL